MKTLRPLALKPLSVREIRPAGWLRRQLEIQAEGLCGNLDRFWPDVKDSGWFGGAEEGWERAPYWLDGLIPLAWLLGDKALQQRAARCMDCILDRQQPDGWLGPGTSQKEKSAADLWALFLILMVLTVYEVVSGEARVQPAVRAALRYIDRHIDHYTLSGWAQMRWFECLIPIWWLYERQPEEWLLHLAQKLQAQGFDWFSFFDAWPYRAPQEKGRWSQMSHAVNNMMMLKSGALYGRMSGQDRHRLFAGRALELLDTYHGMVTGVMTGDECLSGKSPVQGTELCAVAELLYTLETLLSVTGDAKWADRWERVAYNALPAAFSPDMWAHQYDQQVNQVEASVQKDPIFRTNGPDANIYGLEPHFGCCTVNMSQAWPKFAASLLMRAPGGLAVCGYAPCAAETTVQGVPLMLRVDSSYPFRDSACITVESAQPVCFDLLLRRPGYAGKMFVNDTPVTERDWVRLSHSGTKTVLQIRFAWETLQEARPERMTAVTRGPLVFAAAIEEAWRQIPSDDLLKAFPHCDYEVLPRSEWRYALSDSAAENSVLQAREIGAYPFSPQGAGLSMTVPAVPIAWDMARGAAAYPVVPRRTGDDTVICLLPYGCTSLRITEFPLITDDP